MKQRKNKSQFFKVRCNKCKNEQNVFNKCSSEIKCLVCDEILAMPTGGKSKVIAKILEAMIHISEISPGRIRNLREFVKEGKTIVCTVLNIDLQKGHIDLSLRRVNTSQRVQKLTEFKQEEKAEKFLEIVGKDLNLDLKSMYEKIGKKAIEQYGSLYLFFQNIVANKDLIRDICDDEKLGENIYNFIKDKIKPVEVIISGVLKTISYDDEGINIIKKTLEKAEKEDGVRITYLGAPKYKIDVKAKDYKSAENTLKKVLNEITKDFEKYKCEFECERKKNE